jgi:hypothetical protein
VSPYPHPRTETDPVVLSSIWNSGRRIKSRNPVILSSKTCGYIKLHTATVKPECKLNTVDTSNTQLERDFRIIGAICTPPTVKYALHGTFKLIRVSYKKGRKPFNETIAVYSDNRMKPIKVPVGKIKEFLKVTAADTYSKLKLNSMI